MKTNNILDNSSDKYIVLNDFFRHNISIRYWDINNISTKETILLLHGIGASLEIWIKNIEYLSKYYRVLVFDFPGHGKSSFINNPGLYNTVNMTNLVKAFITKIGISTKITIIAHSVGGMIGTYFSIIYQEFVSKLILVSSAGYGTDIGQKHRLATIPFIGELAFTKLGISIAKNRAKSCLSDSELISPQYIDLLYSYIGSTHGKGILYSLRSEATIHGFSRPFSSSELSTLQIPVLIFCGTKDKSTPIHHFNYSLANIQNAKGILLSGCGHRPQICKDKLFNQLVKYFIDNGHINKYAENKQKIKL